MVESKLQEYRFSVKRGPHWSLYVALEVKWHSGDLGASVDIDGMKRVAMGRASKVRTAVIWSMLMME